MYIYGVADYLVFSLVSSADGETAITAGTPTINITKDGGAQATATNAALHKGNGQWSVLLTATEKQAVTIGVQIALAGAVTRDFQIHTVASDLAADVTAILADTANMQPKLGTPVTDLAADIAAVPTTTQINTAVEGGQVGTDVTAILAGTTVAADEVAEARTFFPGHEGNQSNNIVTLNTWASGTVTLAARFSLNEGTTLLSVDSATVTKNSDQSTVTTSSLAKQTNQTTANFNVAAIAAAGTYTVRVDVTTVDGQKLSITGTLEVE